MTTAVTKFKKDLVAEYAQAEGITKVEAEKRIDAVTGLIVDNLVNGNNVKVANFFNFFVRERAEKEAKNPQTGDPMVIPATKTIVAKMTKPVKERIQSKR